MLKTGRYIYVVFMCHLAVEKLLKAIVAESGEELPPKTPNLRYLVRLGSVKLPSEFVPIVRRLNTASVPTRYPEDLAELQRRISKRVAEEYLNKTRALLKWLKQDERLKG